MACFAVSELKTTRPQFYLQGIHASEESAALWTFIGLNTAASAKDSTRLVLFFEFLVTYSMPFSYNCILQDSLSGWNHD